MSYNLFNRQEILQKAKKTYSKEKAAKYYLQNKEVVKEKARIGIRACQRRKKQNQRVSKEEVSRIDSI